MTRLTPEMIHDVPYAMSDRDRELERSLGRDLKGLAYEAVGLDANAEVEPHHITGGAAITRGIDHRTLDQHLMTVHPLRAGPQLHREAAEAVLPHRSDAEGLRGAVLSAARGSG